MNYKLFDDFIILQAILKRTGIIQSGSTFFLSRRSLFVNGELGTTESKP